MTTREERLVVAALRDRDRTLDGVRRFVRAEWPAADVDRAVEALLDRSAVVPTMLLDADGRWRHGLHLLGAR